MLSRRSEVAGEVPQTLRLARREDEERDGENDRRDREEQRVPDAERDQEPDQQQREEDPEDGEADRRDRAEPEGVQLRGLARQPQGVGRHAPGEPPASTRGSAPPPFEEQV